MSLYSIVHRILRLVKRGHFIDVQGECLSIFLIESCEISLQANFSAVADILMYMFFTTTNGQQNL